MPETYKYFCQDRVKDNLLCKNGVVCGKDYFSQGDLRRHRKTHTGIKDHWCDWPACGSKFHQKTQLKNHRHTHTGETPHMCDICQEKFKDPSSCSRHRKEQHEGNYVCFVDGCRKTIARKSNFRQHLQGHRAYRPGMVLEDHWARHDQTRPKRIKRMSGPSKSRIATKVDNPLAMSFKPEVHEELSGSIEVPQLNMTNASMPNQTPLPDEAHPVVQSHESQEPQSEKVLELDFQEFINSQNLSPSFTPPSLSSSGSWSSSASYLSSHQLATYPDSRAFYPMPIQLGFDTRSLLSWNESPMPPNYETLPPWIDGPSPAQSSINSGPSPYVWSAEGYSSFDTDLHMASWA